MSLVSGLNVTFGSVVDEQDVAKYETGCKFAAVPAG